VQAIEVRVFRLVEGVDEAAFIAADAAFQGVAHRQPGIVRRTLARGDSGDWLVETWWWSPEDAATGLAGSDELLAMIDPSSVRVRVFETLPG
jgi:hypothetical protein